jgi:competence ComEA-like helix-hairpin-helix protein
MIRNILAVLTILAFVASPAFAETAQPTPGTPAKSAPKTTPKAPAKQEPLATKINLNTANAQELDKLPQIGPARAKAIIDARAKGPFKNWEDFVARKVVPSNAERAIKDSVTF